MTAFPKDGKDAALDLKESKKVRGRSGYRCEVVFGSWSAVQSRCHGRAVHVHHLIGGAYRGVGISALAIHKLHCCDRCHRAIHGDVGGRKLIRIGGPVPRFTDPYEFAS